MDTAKTLERYLRHHRAEGSTPKTLDWHRLSIGQFAAFLAEQGHSGDVEDLHADDLRQWIDRLRDKGLAQKSVQTKVRSVKAFGKWLEVEEYVRRDPFARVKVPKADDKPKDLFDPADVDKLLATCSKTTQTGARDRALILLLYSTGLRASEALGLQTEDIDEDRGAVVVRRGKGGKFRVVPLGRAVERAIDKYLAHPNRKPRPGVSALFLSDEGEPLKLNALQCMLQRRGKDAGVHANAHKFRHSGATQYLRNGGKVEALKAMLGHTTLDMTLCYARIAGVDLTTAHETADPTRSLKTRV